MPPASRRPARRATGPRVAATDELGGALAHGREQTAITARPACGRPIAWVRRDAGGIARALSLLVGGAVEMAGRACACPLTDEEWEALEDDADTPLDD